MELAERMRAQNQEQFHTLVRMHLSFQLDLNTDENEVPNNDKIKFRKLFNFHKKLKSGTAGNGGAGCSGSGGGSNKTQNSPSCHNMMKKPLSMKGIQQLRCLIRFLLEEHNIIQEGIFRRTGSLVRQSELKSKLIDDVEIELSNGSYSVHDCASVLKGVLSDLPEPLLMDSYYPAHVQMAELCNEMNSLECSITAQSAKSTRLLHSLQLLILLLPMENRVLLKDVIEMLNQIIRFECKNKMSADSLATLFTPHLICPKKLSPEAMHQTSQTLSGIISFMITKGGEIFDIPPKLATDIRAYFVEQKRRELRSPDLILDESVTSDSTANTVFTFIDRERTAQAHVQNPTDTSLAQLYAYIQSLPESTKKRKLIKQFNKENGQGTPLQLQMLHRIKNTSTSSSSSNAGGSSTGCSGTSSSSSSATKSNGGTKSLSDSIKRHIFQKNLISKTPKQYQQQPKNHHQLNKQNLTPSSIASPSSTVLFDKSNRLNAKSRLLFHSPAVTPKGKELTPNNKPSTITKFNNIDSGGGVSSGKASSSDVKNQSTIRNDNTIEKYQQQQKIKECPSTKIEPIVASSSQIHFSRKSVLFSSLNSNNKNYYGHLTPTYQYQYSHNNSKLKKNVDNDFKSKSVPNLYNISSQPPSVPAPPPPPPSISSLSQSSSSSVTSRNCTTTKSFKEYKDHDNRNGKNLLQKSISLSNLSTNENLPNINVVCVNDSNENYDEDEEEDEDIDDPDFEATPNSTAYSFNQTINSSQYSMVVGSSGAAKASATAIDVGTDNNTMELYLTTPKNRLLDCRRRSMSPITKSTQRMSKAMQESIMTPRSRKPVMLIGLLANAGGGGGRSNTDDSGGSTPSIENSYFAPVQEEEAMEDCQTINYGAEYTNIINKTSKLQKLPMNLNRSKSLNDLYEIFSHHEPYQQQNNENILQILKSASDSALYDPLSIPFRNYLYSRFNAVPASPVDSSFSSHPDDFGSEPDLQHLTETNELSDSLLYCLDGNRPSSSIATAITTISVGGDSVTAFNSLSSSSATSSSASSSASSSTSSSASSTKTLKDGSASLTPMTRKRSNFSNNIELDDDNLVKQKKMLLVNAAVAEHHQKQQDHHHMQHQQKKQQEQQQQRPGETSL